MSWQEIPNPPNPRKIWSLTFDFKSSYASFCSLHMNQIKSQNPKLIRNNEFKSFNPYANTSSHESKYIYIYIIRIHKLQGNW